MEHNFLRTQFLSKTRQVTFLFFCYIFLGKDISYSELKCLMEKSKDLVLVDVRSKDEVDKGRIPGSIHIPCELQTNRPEHCALLPLLLIY